MRASSFPSADATNIPTRADPVAHIISLNIHRRHLTKQQQADLIVAAIKAGEKPPQLEEVSEKARPNNRRERGDSKRNLPKAARQGQSGEGQGRRRWQHGISKATVERSLAKAEGRTPKPKAKAEPVEDDELERDRKECIALIKACEAESESAKAEGKTQKPKATTPRPTRPTKPPVGTGGWPRGRDQGWDCAEDALQNVKGLANNSSLEDATLEAVEADLQGLGAGLRAGAEKRAAMVGRASSRETSLDVAPDGRSEVVAGDPAPENEGYDLGDIPADFDRRRAHGG